MSRAVRFAATAAALGLVLAACAAQKDTGLPSSPTPEPIAANLVKVVDSAFQPNHYALKAGDSIAWQFTGAAPHNVKFTTLKEKGQPLSSNPACTKAGTGCATTGEIFKHTFTSKGTFFYYCVVHGDPTLAYDAPGNMAGEIVVS